MSALAYQLIKSQTYTTTSLGSALASTHSRELAVTKRIPIIRFVCLVVEIYDRFTIRVSQECYLDIPAAFITNVLSPGRLLKVLAARAREFDIAVAAPEVADIHQTAWDAASCRAGAT